MNTGTRFEAVKRQGFMVVTTRRGHRQVWFDDQPITPFGHASDWRRKNAVSALSRAGVLWPHATDRR